MIRVWLECLCIFSSVFGIYSAENGVHRVSRQDFNSNGGFAGAAASYQQPFESRNGVYRVQRQDFTNANDVPFSDIYPSPYANRFSKLNYEYGNVSRSYTPLPKLFLPAAPRVENPYLAIGLPNYDRVVPASNFGKEYQTRTSAPTRVTLRPQIAIYDDKRYDDGALPALPNYSQYDLPLPSISDYSKSSPNDEDFSSVVEQFDMTEDKKSICKGENCRKSNTNDDDEAVEPIRRRRSLDYDPYNSFDRHYDSYNPFGRQYDSYHPFGRHYDSYNPYGRHYYGHHVGFFSPYRKSRSFGYPVYDHENDRVYSYLNSLSASRNPFYESSKTDTEVSTEESETSPSTDEYSTSTESNAGFQSSTNSVPVEENIPIDSDEYELPVVSMDRTTSLPESTTVSEPDFIDFHLENMDLPSDDNHDPLVSIDFEALVSKILNEAERETTTIDDRTTEIPTTSADPNQDENIAPIECEFYSETTPSETDPEAESSTTSEDNTEVTTNDSETTPEARGDLTESLTRSSDKIRDIREKFLARLYSHETMDDDLTTSTAETLPESDDSDQDYGTAPVDYGSYMKTIDSETTPESVTETLESTTNSEDDSVHTTGCFDVNAEPLSSQEKFVVLFACAMWPELSKKSGINLQDSESKNLYQLCNFLNAIGDHVVDTPSNSDTSNRDENESETTTTEKLSDNEVFLNFFLQILQEKVDDQSFKAKFEPEPDHDNDADSVSRSSIDIPLVLNLRDI